jgi:Ser/Thr protein kinase RdoA (MazF antagonist)
MIYNVFMYRDLVEKVCGYFEVSPSEAFPYQHGYRNEIWPMRLQSGKMVNLTFYKREIGILERIGRADYVAKYLYDTGLPTKTRYDKRLILMTAENRNVHVGLYNYLEGETIPWEAYSMDHLKSLGKTMSRMHASLAKLPPIKLPSVYDEYRAIFRRLDKYFEERGVKRAMRSKLKLKMRDGHLDFCQQVIRRANGLPYFQAVHMDFVRGNILFAGKDVVGILDFEKVAIGHTITDVARTLAFLLVDCKYKTPQKITKYFLDSGYIKHGGSPDTFDRKFLDELIDVFLTYDFYKFLAHNPYESLKNNEHFTRTRDILIERSVLSYIQKNEGKI